MLFLAVGTMALAVAVAAIPSLRFRSLPDIPTSCQNICTPFVPFLSGNSCAIAECCLPIFQLGYFDCFGCVGNATNVTDFTLAQEYVDVLTTSCLSQNLSLPVLTLPGQDPNRTLTTALPSGASSLPIFGPSPSSTVRPSATISTSSRKVISSFSSPSPSSQSSATATSSLSLSSGVSASLSVLQSSSVPQSSATSPASSASAASPSGSAPSSATRALHFDRLVGFIAFVSIVLFA